MDYEETIHDLKVKYDNTFVALVLPSGQRLPYYINEIYTDMDEVDDEDTDPDEYEQVPAEWAVFHGRVYHSPANWGASWPMKVKLKDLDFEVPKLGVYEVQDSAIFGSRLAMLGSPMKYRKTLSPESIALVDASLMEKKRLGDYDMNRNILQPEYLYAAYNNQPYRSLEDSLKTLEEPDRLGCSLNELYSIHLDNATEYFKIAREGNVVGYYYPEEEVVRVISQHLDPLFEELSEIGFNVRRNEYVEDGEHVIIDDEATMKVNWDVLWVPNLDDHFVSFALEDM